MVTVTGVKVGQMQGRGHDPVNRKVGQDGQHSDIAGRKDEHLPVDRLGRFELTVGGAQDPQFGQGRNVFGVVSQDLPNQGFGAVQLAAVLVGYGLHQQLGRRRFCHEVWDNKHAQAEAIPVPSRYPNHRRQGFR